MSTLEGTATIVLDYTPASLNSVGSRGHWRKFHAAKTSLQRDLELLLIAERLPRPVAAVVATADLRFPVARRRDEGNFRVLLEKALGDALVNGGWLADDTPDQFRFAGPAFDSGLGPPRTRLELAYRTARGPS